MPELPYGSSSPTPPADYTGVCIYNCNPGVVTHAYDASKDAMWAYYREHECPVVGVFQRPGTSVLSIARSTACSHFLNETTGEWMLFIDSDIEWLPGDIDLMLEVCDPVTSPIVCGLYVSSLPEGLHPVAWHDENTIFGAEETAAWVAEGRRLIPAHRVGAGFLMVHRDALTKMYANNPEDAWYGEIIDNGVKNGEDFTFCYRARACGLPIFVDVGVTLGHVKTIVLSKSMLGNVQIETRTTG